MIRTTNLEIRIAAASNAMAGRPEQAHKAVARLRQLNPTLRVSNLKDVLGPYGMKVSLDMKKDCGKPGCPSDRRSLSYPNAAAR